MPREIITVNVGGCGINIGKATLEQYCIEQGIGSNGKKQCKTMYDDSITTLFDETSNGQYISRNLCVDLDPYSIEQARKRYKYKNLLQDDYLLSGKHDTALNFAMGHYTVGKEIIDKVNYALQTLVEGCDNLQGFIINHSFSGGTGSGLGCLILERIAVDYRKKCKFGVEIFPNENRLIQSMELYNSMLSLHWLLDHTELSIVIDNKALDKQCQKALNIKSPNYNDYNNLTTKLMSNITANSRFALNEGLGSIHCGLVPFPRLHFVMPTMTPILPIDGNMKDEEKKDDQDDDDDDIDYDDIETLIKQSLLPKNFMIDFTDYNPLTDKYMASSFCFRGNEINKDWNQIDETMLKINKDNEITFVEWASTKPSVKFVEGPVAKSPNNQDVMKIPNKQVTMIGNTTRFGRFYMNRIGDHYDRMYSQRSYVHHYVNEGMEEGEFAEAREDLGFLLMDYTDVLTTFVSDDDDDY